MSFATFVQVFGKAASIVAFLDPDPTSKAILGAVSTGAAELPVALTDVEKLWTDVSPAATQFKAALATVDGHMAAGEPIPAEHMQALQAATAGVLSNDQVQAILDMRDTALRGT